jgi:amino acid transporter
MKSEPSVGLIRAIGRWSFAALVVNSVIGSGVFGLPSAVALHVGAASPYAVLLAAVGMGMMMACFAEVASQFRDAGGPYLYARAAFGRFIGLQMGWIAWLVRITAASANANLFVDYLAEFWPSASSTFPRMAVLTGVIGLLAAVNYRGVKAGANTSTFFTLAKLLPLTVFIVIGLTVFGVQLPSPFETSTHQDWPKALLLLAFAYGGFDAALIPIAEVKNPRRDAPFGLLFALGVVTTIYTLIQIVVMSALPTPEATKRPLADAAHVFMGNSGAALITAGALISVFGYLSASMLNVPRLTYALAEARDFPRTFGLVHPKFHTPHVSIIIYAVVLWGVTVAGSFQWNASLSAVARLFSYSFVCGALIKLRLDKPAADAFRLKFGPVFASLGILFALYLLSGMSSIEFLIMATTIVIAFVHWVVVKHSGHEAQRR